ncbi:ADP-ribosyl cyclase/cyclic ADP-ribose hydrolase 1-like [Labrus bergylta]|uniref:ADP-ribosyl cyclase/cyclic ADP-ribose hydrolase 1-like n=1 Tax=Labrus bergylta TaxID=56723 RepID=UPI0033142A81
MVSKKALAIGVIVTVVVVVVIVVPSVLLTQKAEFRETFMKKCLEFPEEEHICETIWTNFELAYVGKEKCNFSDQNYDQLLAETPFKHPCGKTMFWSKTKDLVHKFTKKRDCFFTLEDTLLGYVLNGLSWCGEKGNNETFTENCEDCLPNPVSSFWKIASTRFAQYTCEGASVMLDGERKEPYDSNSFFGGVEVPNLQPPRVKNLTVVLVTEEIRACTCDSLGTLRKDLDQRIGCACKAVTKSRVETCIEDNTPCGACW